MTISLCHLDSNGIWWQFYPQPPIPFALQVGLVLSLWGTGRTHVVFLQVSRKMFCCHITQTTFWVPINKLDTNNEANLISRSYNCFQDDFHVCVTHPLIRGISTLQYVWDCGKALFLWKFFTKKKIPQRIKGTVCCNAITYYLVESSFTEQKKR